MTNAEAGQILYLAAIEPIGLLLRVSNTVQAKNRLYQVRSKLGDPAISGLQIRTSPLEDGDLILVNEKIQLSKTRLEPSLEDMGL